MFLFLPSVSIFIRSFEAVDGSFTFDNIVALFTVSCQSVRAATANPVESLRYE